ncbi:MAG: Fe-S cluster assembly protein SufD [Chthoniobacterales bacterium]
MDTVTIDSDSAGESIRKEATLYRSPSMRWPEWFRTEQNEAWENFKSLANPTRQNQNWRYSNLSINENTDACNASAPLNPDALIHRSRSLVDDTYKLVFANDELLTRLPADLPEGVILKTLPAAATENEDLFRRYFMSKPVALGSEKAAALHRSQVNGGLFLYIPKNVVIEKPIEVFHWVTGENSAVFPHTLIVCEENSEVTFIDRFQSGDALSAFAYAVNDLHVAQSAKLHYTSVQEWSKETKAFHLNATSLEKNASCTALNVHLGAHLVRAENHSYMTGEGAHSVMLSMSPLSGTREVDQRTLQEHAAPNATSDLLYHNALSDKSRSTFSGLLKVADGAHKTDAYQKVRNLLLSDEAEANSMPGLEILADDVRCSHGATSAQLNSDELFYMQARGIPSDQACRLILFGFFNEMLERFGREDIREAVCNLLKVQYEL